MDQIVHPKPCTYNLRGDCAWMRAYAMLCAHISHPEQAELKIKHLAEALGTYHHYVAGNLDMDVSSVRAMVEYYRQQLSVGANGKDAEDEEPTEA